MPSSRFLTLMQREWMQHHRGWLMLMFNTKTTGDGPVGGPLLPGEGGPDGGGGGMPYANV